MFSRAWNIWFVATLFVAFQLFIGMLFGLSVHELSKSLAISETDVSNLVAVYFFAYALMQIPAGFLIDKFRSVKSTLVIVDIFMVLGLLLLGSTHSFFVAVIASIIMGFASSFNFVAAVILIGRWLPQNMFSVAVGMTSGLNGLFASLLGYLVLYVSPLIKINEVFITAFAGIVILILIVIVIKEFPHDREIEKYETNSKFNLISAVKSALFSRQIILASLVTGLIYGSMLAFLTFWNVQYQKFYNIDLKTISIINIIALSGIAVGAPTLGWISEKKGNRKSVAAAASICLFVMFLIILQPVGLSMPVLYAVMFLLGFFANNVSIGFSIVKDNAEPEYIGTSIAVANTVLFLCLSAFQFFPGKIAEIIKVADNFILSQYVSEQVAVLSVSLSIYIVAILAALVLLFFIKDKKV